MEMTYEDLVSDLTARGLTLRAIRKVAEDEGIPLPKDDEPLVRLMIDSLQEDCNESVLGPS